MDFAQLATMVKIIGAAVAVVSAIALAYGVFIGVLPTLIRLGKGLSRRKVSIFAAGAELASIQNHLTDSRLFKQKNILSVQSLSEISRAEDCSVFVVYWNQWKDNLDSILKIKKDRTALLIYAPQIDGFIPKDDMAKLETHRNVIVTNFRGRLMNDLVVTMISSGYEKR